MGTGRRRTTSNRPRIRVGRAGTNGLAFAAQQASEKAVKALHLKLGQEAWGYVIARRLRDLPPQAAVPEELVAKARLLDAHYIPPRYPNGHPEGTPFENYCPIQSREAIAHAREILEFAGARLA